MTAAAGSNIGLRKDNEDRYYINEDEKIFMIADGMGGHEHGQLASKLAVATMAENILKLEQPLSLEKLEEIFKSVNTSVYELQQQLNADVIGTTLTAAIVRDEQLYIAHAGDSRLYRLRDNKLEQLTIDHTYYAEMLRLGQLDEAQTEVKRNVLLKALGPEENIEGQYLQLEILPEDLLLLFTDGLYNVLSEEEILQQVSAEDNMAICVENLLQMALERGARDNLTVVLYRHEGEVRP